MTVIEKISMSCNIRINVYDNDFTLIIDIYFYETFSTLNLK